MDYIVKKSDIANGQFIIKPYTTNGPAKPTAATPLDPHAVSANTSLRLLGQGMAEYGEIVATDFVHLLENFSNPIAPVYPIQGQLWYNNSTEQLTLYNTTWQQIVINGKLNVDLDVNSHKVSNVSDPTVPGDAVNLSYFTANAFTIAGATMLPGADIIFQGGGEVLGLPAIPSDNTAATSKLYVDTQDAALDASLQAWANLRFVLLTGDITRDADTHIYLQTPVGGFLTDNDVVNKKYVDDLTANISSFVHKTGDIITGTLNITGLTMYNGPIMGVVDSSITATTVSVPENVTGFFTATKRLPTVLNASSGYQMIDLGGGSLLADPTGLADVTFVPATAGKTTLAWSGPIIGDTIANGTFDFDVQVDAEVAPTTYTVIINVLDTLADIASKMSSQLAAVAIVSSTTDSIIITSLTTGLGSKVIVTEPTTGINPDLFVAIDTGKTLTHTNTELDGADATGYTYDATVTVDGTNIINIAVSGHDAQTFDTLIAAISAQMAPFAYAIMGLVSNNLLIISESSDTTSTVAIVDGLVNPLFSSLTPYVAIMPAVNGYTSQSQTLTVVSSVYDGVLNKTDITTVEPILVTSTPVAQAAIPVFGPFGTVSPMLGLSLDNGATAQFDGNFNILGGNNIDFGGNILHNIDDPVVDTDAANKKFVVDTVNGATGDGHLTSGTFADNTLTLTTTTATGTYDTTIVGMANQIHEHITNESAHNVLAGDAPDSYFRNVFNSALTYPSIPLNTILDAIDSALYSTNSSNDRAVYTIAASTVNAVAEIYNAPIALITGVVTGLGGNYQVLGDFSAIYTVGTTIDIAENVGFPGHHTHLVASSTYDGLTTTTIVINAGETVDPATTPNGFIGSTVIGVVTGAGGSFTISAGDFTLAFVPGIKFLYSGSIGQSYHYVASSSYNAGLNETTIVVSDTIDPLTLANGGISHFYGAYRLAGDVSRQYGPAVRFNLSASVNVASNGDYVTAAVSTVGSPVVTGTWVYLDQTTPLVALSTPNGTVTPYTIQLPFDYTVESNKIQVYVNGVKQYNSTRGYSKITIPVVGQNIVEWYPTNLPAATYTFNVAVNGGAPTVPSIVVAYTPYTITAVDLVANSWTITGAIAGTFEQFMLFEVIGNAGLPPVVGYTIKEAITTGIDTILYVNEPIDIAATVSGSAQVPYTYSMLLVDIQNQLNGLYPPPLLPPIVKYHHGQLYMWAPNSSFLGSISSVAVTDVDLFSALSANSSIDNYVTGVEYSYQEPGIVFQASRLIDFSTLPVVGEVIECITNG
jgi:hypothetical protein